MDGYYINENMCEIWENDIYLHTSNINLRQTSFDIVGSMCFTWNLWFSSLSPLMVVSCNNKYFVFSNASA